jgi:hypothetical protein
MTFWQVIAPYVGCQPSSNSMVLCRRWAMEPLLGHCRLLYRQHESAHAPAGEQRRSGKVRWGWCLSVAILRSVSHVLAQWHSLPSPDIWPCVIWSVSNIFKSKRIVHFQRVLSIESRFQQRVQVSHICFFVCPIFTSVTVQ